MNAEDGSTINVRQFLEEWSNCLLEDDVTETTNSFSTFAELMLQETPEMLSELNTVCGPLTLGCEGEPERAVDMLHAVSDKVDLVTTSIQKKELQKRADDSVYRSRIFAQMKHRVLHETVLNDISSCQAGDTNSAIIQPDVILNVRIYKPYHRDEKNVVPVINQEFQVLGQQLLTELKDKIMCVADTAIPGEFSENPDSDFTLQAKEIYPSSFFFFEGVFYNDMRHPAAIDYSSTIIDWSRDAGRGIGPFESTRMEITTFLDLKLKLGHPYVYVHQGNCEHLVIFSDLRLVHGSDSKLLDAYPLLTYKCRAQRNVCRVCLTHSAKFFVRGSILSPEDPCFFCDSCYRMLHYDRDGRKLFNFQACPVSDHTISV